jgi:hypothetical protein
VLIDSTNLQQASEQFVRQLFNQKADRRLICHNYGLAQRLVRAIEHLAIRNEINDAESIDILKTSGWFYFSGYTQSIAAPAEQSIEIAKTFFIKNEIPQDIAGAVERLIQTAYSEKSPEFLLGQTLKDAVQGLCYGQDFQQIEALEKLEREWGGDSSFDDFSWTQYKLQELLKVQFLTKAGKELYEPEIASNILLQKNKLEKQGKKLKSVSKGKEEASPYSPNAQRTIQTFFRANYRNHINLSAIADNKANIMISVNAIIISVIISILSYRNLTEANPMILMPSIIFLVCGLTSLIFAVLSARPKVTSLNGKATPLQDLKKNLVFFGNFVQLDVTQFQAGMEEIFKDDKLLIDNMTRDLYYLGKVLDKKYRYLSFSYNVFMAGFALTVLTFLFVFLTT